MLFYLRPVEEDDAQVVEVERDAAAFVLPHGVPQPAHGRRVADAFDDKYRAATSPLHALTEHFLYKVGTPPVVQIKKIDRNARLQEQFVQLRSCV